jgi:BirA family transcriptional regulator, biotin operon repressor / biotin---[acetyl-CoA-carboxylase] ligase
VKELDRPAALASDLAVPLERAIAAGDLAPLGAEVLYYPIATSTNDLAARLADRGGADGTIIIADEQTAGRGRGGHTWFSPPGAGLYVSLIVRGTTTGAESSWARWLTLAAGVAIAEGLHAASGLPVSIKWPNDLVMAPAGTVRGSRKLGGILAEARTDGGRLTHVIVGFGINVGRSAFPPEISARATSLEDELGRDVDRGAVLTALLRRFATWLVRLRGGRTPEVVARWRALAVGAAGSSIEWQSEGGPRRGVTAGIDPEGALLVRAGALTERIVAGEVTWL